jgi:hypothetical protein
MVQCSAYTSHEEASHAVAALLAAGVPGDGIRVLMGQPARDARSEDEGAFAGAVAAGAPVGSFAGAAHARDAAVGAFAGESQRGGSFADADREVVTSYPEGVAKMDVAGHRRVRELLMEAGLDAATAARDVERLHEGRILVLAQVQASAERADQ